MDLQTYTIKIQELSSLPSHLKDRFILLGASLNNDQARRECFAMIEQSGEEIAEAMADDSSQLDEIELFLESEERKIHAHQHQDDETQDRTKTMESMDQQLNSLS